MEAIEVSQVARLVDLVNVRLLRGELDVVANLVADVAQQLVVDEVLDNGMLVAGELIRTVLVGSCNWFIRLRVCVVLRVSVEYLGVEEAGAEVALRLAIRDGSLFLRLAVGRRLVLAFCHGLQSLTKSLRETWSGCSRISERLAGGFHGQVCRCRDAHVGNFQSHRHEADLSTDAAPWDVWTSNDNRTTTTTRKAYFPWHYSFLPAHRSSEAYLDSIL